MEAAEIRKVVEQILQEKGLSNLLDMFQREHLVPRGTHNLDDGWSGTFVNGDGDTVTVANGVITDVS